MLCTQLLYAKVMGLMTFMDKKTFLNSIAYEDKILLSNLYDKIILANKVNTIVYTNEFYPPNVWRTLEKNSCGLGVNVYTYGVFEEAERRIIAFSNFDEVYSYPIKLIKVTSKSSFNKLEHKDFLGSLMSLGFKREKFGDLLMNEDSCYFTICEDVSNYVLVNMSSVGRTPCNVEVIDIDRYDEMPKAKFCDIIINTTSLRLDCVVGSICGMSRNKAVLLINQGKVLVDYVEVSEKDFLVERESCITIRGYGKFKIGEEIGMSLSGRCKLAIKKYI